MSHLIFPFSVFLRSGNRRFRRCSAGSYVLQVGSLTDFRPVIVHCSIGEKRRYHQPALYFSLLPRVVDFGLFHGQSFQTRVENRAIMAYASRDHDHRYGW